MDPKEQEPAVLFPHVASHLRDELSRLYLAVRRLAPVKDRERSAKKDRDAAWVDQCYYRMLRMVNNLAATAYWNGEKAFRMSYHDIVDIVGRICAESGDLAELNGITLTFSCPMESHMCLIDAQAVELLVYQLLSNAVKFTPSGGKITVELRRRDKQLVLEVADTGCGISEELLPTLFDVLRNAEREDLSPHGIGLGLPLCRCIAEAHGGTMFVESAPGRGSRFTAAFPDYAMELYLMEEQEPNYTSGFNRSLMGLSDALTAEAFRLRNE